MAVKIDQKVWDELRVDINAALQAVIQKHGLTKLQLGNCTFTRDGAFTFQLQGILKGGDTKEVTAYNALRGLCPELPELGTEFEYRDQPYKISGANTTLTKVKATFDGKTFLFDTEYVRQQFEKAAATPKKSRK